MNALLGLFKPKTVTPSYGDVFTEMSDKELHDAFIAYEVLQYADDTQHILFKNGRKCLREIAANHNWDYTMFLDIIADEYDCLHNK